MSKMSNSDLRTVVEIANDILKERFRAGRSFKVVKVTTPQHEFLVGRTGQILAGLRYDGHFKSEIDTYEWWFLPEEVEFLD